MVAVLTEAGGYSVLEPLGHDFEVGDEVTGNLESLGGETVRVNRTTSVQVFIQDIHGSQQVALRLIGLRR